MDESLLTPPQRQMRRGVLRHAPSHLPSFCLQKEGLNGRIAGVKWTPLKIYALKLALFTTVLGYMALDLMLFHGPMYDFLHSRAAAGALPAAEVYGEAVTPAQLARYSAEQDMLAGLSEPSKGKELSRTLDMVRAAVVRLRTRYNDLKLPSMRQHAVDEVSKLASRCATTQEFEQQLASQGYTIASFTDKMESRLRGEVLLFRALEPYCEVSNAAVAAHYRILREELSIPASRPVKHIFLATLDKDAAAVKAAAEVLLARLDAGEDFSDLAAEASEDEASAPNGGKLGTISDDGRSPLPELPLFGDNALPAGTPTLVQSRWGWHIIQAGPITPAYTPSLDECRESLRTAIISSQQELGLRAYFDAALKEGIQQKHIQIHVK